MSLNANEFLSLIRETIDQQLSTRSHDAVGVVRSVNNDGSLDMTFPPDNSTVIHGVPNQTRYNFSKGDMALVYIVQNKLQDAFVIGKYRARASDDIYADLLKKIEDNSSAERAVSEIIYSTTGTDARIEGGVLIFD